MRTAPQHNEFVQPEEEIHFNESYGKAKMKDQERHTYYIYIYRPKEFLSLTCDLVRAPVCFSVQERAPVHKLAKSVCVHCSLCMCTVRSLIVIMIIAYAVCKMPACCPGFMRTLKMPIDIPSNCLRVFFDATTRLNEKQNRTETDIQTWLWIITLAVCSHEPRNRIDLKAMRTIIELNMYSLMRFERWCRPPAWHV